jgi:hypothetical protein
MMSAKQNYRFSRRFIVGRHKFLTLKNTWQKNRQHLDSQGHEDY